MPYQFPISSPCPFERTNELGVAHFTMDALDNQNWISLHAYVI
jgi:hypothetical protein